MSKRIPAVCCDCAAEWVYVNTRPQGGGAVPPRCAQCRELRRSKVAADYRSTHTLNARRWRLDNPDKMQSARAAWEADNKETRREYRRAGKRKNPEANRAYVRRRQMRKRGQTVVPFTAAQLADRLRYFDNRCWMCGAEGTEIDHAKPISRGGAHALCNLRPACGPCNSRKGAKWPFQTSPSSSLGRVNALTAGERLNG